MNALRLLTVGTMVCVLTVSAKADDTKEKPDNAKLLVGKWEVTRADKELPVGAVMEFNKDGEMKITRKEHGKEESVNAVYKVEGNKLQFTLKLGQREEKKDPLTIKKISEQALVLEAKGGVVFEFKSVLAADSKVTGKVWLVVAGKPLASGRIFFHLNNGQFVGSKVKDGDYSIDRVPVGTHKVTVEGQGVPEKYAAEDTSGLTVEVTEGTFTFDVILQR